MRLTQILFRNYWECVPGTVAPTTEKYSNLPKSYIRRAMRQVSIGRSKYFFLNISFFLHIYEYHFYQSIRLNGKRQEEIYATYQEQLNEETFDSHQIGHGLQVFINKMHQEDLLKKFSLNQSVISYDFY